MRLPRFKANTPILDQLTETRLNKLLDYIESLELQQSPSVRVTRTPGGTIAEVKRPNSSSIDHPFRVLYSGSGTTTASITVRIGVLYVSDNPIEITISGNPLSTDTAENVLEIDANTAGYVGLLLTVDDTDPYAISCSACEVNFEETEPANTLTERWIRLAGISASGLVTQEIYRSIYSARAGDYEETDSLQLW